MVSIEQLLAARNEYDNIVDSFMGHWTPLMERIFNELVLVGKYQKFPRTYYYAEVETDDNVIVLHWRQSELDCGDSTIFCIRPTDDFDVEDYIKEKKEEHLNTLMKQKQESKDKRIKALQAELELLQNS